MKILSVFKNRCPNCEKGRIFQKESEFVNISIPKMNNTCPSCKFKFMKETGFFYGAMYVSYALTVAEGFIWFILGYFILGLSLMTNFLIITSLAFLLSKFNFKISRTIWIYIFYKQP
ncbi:DUF983 domain-containing protein [Zunongwangia atlantica]|nr:DUF983 domain-containing protein [Zunongwangia atlantica]